MGCYYWLLVHLRKQHQTWWSENTIYCQDAEVFARLSHYCSRHGSWNTHGHVPEGTIWRDPRRAAKVSGDLHDGITHMFKRMSNAIMGEIVAAFSDTSFILG